MSDLSTSTSDHANRNVVRQFFAILGDDLPAAVERFGADEISWTLPPTLPGGRRPWEGKTAVVKFLTGMQAGFAPRSMRIEVLDMIGEGDRFALRVHITARSIKDVPYENDYAFFIRCKNGQITQVNEYVDSARVLQIFG